ncbi:transglycosylase domain-containing protein, partial [Corynebacterium amycolatum]
LPQASTIQDREGNTIAWIYDQRRFDVPADKISSAMKESIVAIEDRRFYEHNGVDLRGSARALAANLSSGGVAEGASTLNQQYIKNYLWLIRAKNDDERAAATETSLAR